MEKMTSKLLVTVLLTFGGLLCPPRLVEALNCYQCGDNLVCNGSNQKEVQCDARATGCLLMKQPGLLQKACGTKEPMFDCIQQKMNQNGDCIRGSVEEVERAGNECGATKTTSEDRVELENILKFITNEAKTRRGSEFQPKQNEEVVMCHCTTNLCNNEGGSGGGGGEEGDSGASGQMVGTGVLTVTGITLLVRNRLLL